MSLMGSNQARSLADIHTNRPSGRLSIAIMTPTKMWPFTAMTIPATAAITTARTPSEVARAGNCRDMGGG